MLMEMLIIIIHPPIFFDFEFNITQSGGNKSVYHFDEIVTSFASLKLYFMLKLLPEFSMVSSEKARKICEMHGFYPDYFFYFKVILIEKAIIVLPSLLMLLYFILGATI